MLHGRTRRGATLTPSVQADRRARADTRRVEDTYPPVRSGAGLGASSVNDLHSQQHPMWNRKPERLGRFHMETRSKRVGCSIGRSAGLAPFSILST